MTLLPRPVWLLASLSAAPLSFLGFSLGSLPWHNLRCRVGHYESARVESDAHAFLVTPVWICDERKGGRP